MHAQGWEMGGGIEGPSEQCSGGSRVSSAGALMVLRCPCHARTQVQSFGMPHMYSSPLSYLPGTYQCFLLEAGKITQRAGAWVSCKKTPDLISGTTWPPSSNGK